MNPVDQSGNGQETAWRGEKSHRRPEAARSRARRAKRIRAARRARKLLAR